MESEEIEETDKLIRELLGLSSDLKIFRDFEDQIEEGLRNFQRENYHASFNTLLDTVEGVVRKIFTEFGFGGTSGALVPMIEKLRAEKLVRKGTEHLIRGLDRNLPNHGLLMIIETFQKPSLNFLFFV
ncbi:hypothetical protein AKJ58_00310 [candidate division MSBL1 archaeon SCGC-AAA385D11]|uniref:Uncharacterized protein n=1 Tax=candidate division MSBL1 archaeon SCGC-AAA385D11 TaxID=1698286 RepID=A0A133VPC8_9EURY|nr:hypothetical protein AKJ58_00310 [candidate division MSBL1 archaeon SCGC-AAA385D11]